MRPDSNPPRRSGPCPRIRTTQKLRGHGPLPHKQRGFGLVAAMFLIIIIAGAIAAMWRISATQTATSSLALQQTRAYQAARAGVEYGIARVMSGSACVSPFALEGFKVTVDCAVPRQVDLPEEGRKAEFHSIEVTAEYGTLGAPGYAYRKIFAEVEK